MKREWNLLGYFQTPKKYIQTVDTFSSTMTMKSFDRYCGWWFVIPSLWEKLRGIIGHVSNHCRHSTLTRHQEFVAWPHLAPRLACFTIDQSPSSEVWCDDFTTPSSYPVGAGPWRWLRSFVIQKSYFHFFFSCVFIGLTMNWFFLFFRFRNFCCRIDFLSFRGW